MGKPVSGLYTLQACASSAAHMRRRNYIRNCSTLSMTVGVPLSVAAGPVKGWQSAERTAFTSPSGPDTTQRPLAIQDGRRDEEALLTIHCNRTRRSTNFFLQNLPYVRPAGPACNASARERESSVGACGERRRGRARTKVVCVRVRRSARPRPLRARGPLVGLLVATSVFFFDAG